MVKIVNKIRLQDEEPKSTPPTPEDIMLLREIRDSLKK
jgi:large conductance mechanosensitive channel